MDGNRNRVPGVGAGIATRRFWQCYWITTRPYLLFLSGAAGLVGASLVEADWMPLWRLALTFVAFFFTYGLGQALTDVFQVDTDSISAPYRPLVRGEIARGQVFVVSVLGLSACATVFAVLNPWTLLLSGAGVIGLSTYTYFKRLFWAGPFWNAWIVALLPIMGFMCGGADPREAFSNVTLLVFAASIFFSYAIFVLLGYFKDIDADRATDYRTLPVVFGRRVSVVVSAVFWVLATALSAWGVASLVLDVDLWTVVAAALGIYGVVLLGWSHVKMRTVHRDEDAYPAIAMVVKGFVALAAGEAALARPLLTLPAVALYGFFELVLARRPAREQI